MCRLDWRHITSWADVHANLPSGARWFAFKQMWLLGATKPAASALHQLEGFLFSDTPISDELLQAYRATDYHVEAAVPFVWRVGQASPDLLHLYAKHQCECAAFLTACNPFSEIAAELENEVRQAGLANELRKRGLHFFNGIGQDTLGAWPGEPSFFVLGLSLEAAKRLGREQDQNALIWCGPDAVPLLVLLI